MPACLRIDGYKLNFAFDQSSEYKRLQLEVKLGWGVRVAEDLSSKGLLKGTQSVQPEMSK